VRSGTSLVLQISVSMGDFIEMDGVFYEVEDLTNELSSEDDDDDSWLPFLSDDEDDWLDCQAYWAQQKQLRQLNESKFLEFVKLFPFDLWWHSIVRPYFTKVELRYLIQGLDPWHKFSLDQWSIIDRHLSWD